MADSGVDTRVNVRIISMVVAPFELSQGLKGYYQVVFGGETIAGEPTGKAVIDVMIIGIAGKPFVDICSPVAASLSTASGIVTVAVGGLSANRSSHTGLVPDPSVERTYEVYLPGCASVERSVWSGNCCSILDGGRRWRALVEVDGGW